MHGAVVANAAAEHSQLESGTIALALQGGGSLGAYTWGVLDALLADSRLRIEGVTGASAGAINAALLAVGLSAGGPDRARELLRTFWEALAAAADRRRVWMFDPVRWLRRNLWRLTSAQAFYELVTRIVADFEIDPGTMEPLRGTLEATLDYTVLSRPDAVRVFVNATNVRTAEPRVFSGPEVNTDAICASAAVPMVMQPVEIDGEHYWDGGLLGDPVVYPVIYGCGTRDIVLVQSRPMECNSVPGTAAEVVSRTVALASSAGLVRELRMIAFVTQLLDEGPRPGYRQIQLHVISPHPSLRTLDCAQMFRADKGFFLHLRQLGHEQARQWLASLDVVASGLDGARVGAPSGRPRG